MTSTARTKKRQQHILDTAAKLFLESGYDAVSLDDILERVGGSKTTLYSYYGGKEGLFAAVVEEICRNKLGPLWAMDVREMTPKAGLRAIGKQLLRTLSDPEGTALFRTMIAEAHRFPQLAATFFAAGPETAVRVLRLAIENWQRKGLLRKGNPADFAVQFLGAIMRNFHSKNLLGLMKPLTEKQMEAWVSRGTDVILEGLLPRKKVKGAVRR